MIHLYIRTDLKASSFSPTPLGLSLISLLKKMFNWRGHRGGKAGEAKIIWFVTRDLFCSLNVTLEKKNN